METRKNVFNLLLTDSEVSDLEWEAEQKGVSKADILRNYFNDPDSMRKEINSQQIAKEISQKIIDYLKDSNSTLKKLKHENQVYRQQIQTFLNCYNAENNYFDYQKGAQVAKDFLENYNK